MFSCSFTGSPSPPNILWFIEGSDVALSLPKYNVTITDDELSSVLSFVTSLEDHDTVYYCEASQTLVTGEVVTATSLSATLTVYCKLWV